MDTDETTRLRALLERAALPACEAYRDEDNGLWTVRPVDGEPGEITAEVVWAHPEPLRDCGATEARAQLFAAIPTALPGLLDAAERAEREHGEAGESTRAAWRESERREQELRDRLIAAERERDDLAATLETRNAEHALAMERVRDLEKDLSRLRRGVVANAGRTSVGRKQRWAYVMDAVGCGSTRAAEMCVAAGFDPDDECGIEPDDDEDEDEDREGGDDVEVSRG